MMNNLPSHTSTSGRLNLLQEVAGHVHARDTSPETRRVQQNVGQNLNLNDNGGGILNDGKGIYLRKVDLDKNNLSNIKMITSNNAAVMERRPFNPNSSLISLEELIEKGSIFGKNLVLIILSISAATANQQTIYQQKSGGVKGNNGIIRHDRSMVVMCPLSKEGSNTAVILFGSGCCERLLNGDPSLRDNGEIRKLFRNYDELNVMFINYFFLRFTCKF